MQPGPVLSPSIKPAGSQEPRPDLQQQPPGQTDPQGLQGLSVGLALLLISSFVLNVF